MPLGPLSTSTELGGVIKLGGVISQLRAARRCLCDTTLRKLTGKQGQLFWSVSLWLFWGSGQTSWLNYATDFRAENTLAGGSGTAGAARPELWPQIKCAYFGGNHNTRLCGSHPCPVCAPGTDNRTCCLLRINNTTGLQWQQRWSWHRDRNDHCLILSKERWYRAFCRGEEACSSWIIYSPHPRSVSTWWILGGWLCTLPAVCPGHIPAWNWSYFLHPLWRGPGHQAPWSHFLSRLWD